VIYIKGDHVKFETPDGSVITLNPRYGIIHDPEGSSLNRCAVYFGPYKATKQKVELDRTGKKYFGPNYTGLRVFVDVPEGPWNSVSEVVKIFYRRPAANRVAIYKGKYFHPYKKLGKPLLLQRSGSYFKVQAPTGCIINWRGFVFP
jgi:hypothetical protein